MHRGSLSSICFTAGSLFQAQSIAEGRKSTVHMAKNLIPASGPVAASKADIRSVLQMPTAPDSSANGLADSSWKKQAPPGFDNIIKKQGSDPNVVVSYQNKFASLVKGRQTDIQSLRFLCGPLTVKTTQTLMQNSWPFLRSLDLCGSQLDQNHMKHLAECSCPNLQNLDLSSNKLGEEAMFRFSSVGEKWPNLEILNLSSSQLDPGSIVHLIKPKFSKLQSLDLRYNDLNYIAVSEVIKGGWPQLRKLALSRGIDEDSCHLLVKAVASKIEWPSLEHLDLSCNKQLDEGAMKKLVRGEWPWLDTVILSGCLLDAKAVSRLSKAKWSNLKNLDLSSNAIGSAAIASLAKGSFRKLEVLNLVCCDLDSATVEHLSKGRWPKLLVVNISMNKVKAAALTGLAAADWPVLEELNLADNELGEDLSLFSDDKPLGWTANKLEPPGWRNFPCLKLLDISKSMAVGKDSATVKRAMQTLHL